MEKTLPAGLYERVLTQGLVEVVSESDALRQLDRDAAPRLLAHLLQEATEKALASFRGDDRLSNQVALTNELLGLLRERAPKSGLETGDLVVTPAQELRGVVPETSGLAESTLPPRPRLPLRSSDLLVNGPRDLRVGAEIPRELASADRVDVLVSFLKWSGVRLILDELRALDDRFGLKVYVDILRKEQYESVVLSYARRAGIDCPRKELLQAFKQWSMRHNHDLVGGRTARDFIRYYLWEQLD